MIIPKSAAERQQWLNSLQVGDEVAVKYNRAGDYHIGKITKITPTRRFSVDNVTRCIFGNDGREMGNIGRIGTRSWLYPVTDQIREQVARSNALYHLRTLHFDSLSTQQLLDILKIIQGDTSK